MSVTVRVPYNFHRRVGKLLHEAGSLFALTCERGFHHTFAKVEHVCILVSSTSRGALEDVLSRHLEVYGSVTHQLGCTHLGLSKVACVPLDLELSEPISRPLLVAVNTITGIEYRHERSQALLYTREAVVTLGGHSTCYLYRAVTDPTPYRPEELLIRGRTLGRSSYYPLELLGAGGEERAAKAAKAGKEPPTNKWLAHKFDLMKRHFPDYRFDRPATAI